MFSKIPSPLLLLLLANLATAADQIKLFINQVPEYSSLADCAEHEVSTIVRGMVNGCGDGSKTTSYNCFCHTSSSYFSSFIGSKVKKACATDNPSLQSSSAVELFDTYCHLGDTLTTDVATTTAFSLSSPTPSASSPDPSSAPTSGTSPSPASAPQTLASSTSSATSSPTTSNGAENDTEPKKKSHTAAVAAGVTIPIALIAIGIAAFLILRRRKQQKQQKPNELPDNNHNGSDDYGALKENPFSEVYAQSVPSVHSGYTGQSGVFELKEETAPMRHVEIGESVVLHEMEQPPTRQAARILH